MKFIIGTVLVAFFAFSQGEPQSQPLKGTTESWKSQLKGFQSQSRSRSLQERYSQISDLWLSVSDHLKSHFVDVSAEQSTEEMREWQAEAARRFQLLRDVSYAREDVLSRFKSERLNVFSVDGKIFEHMVTELTLIPYKFIAYFYQKRFWVTSNLQKGVGGLFFLFVEILLLFSIVLLPFFTFRFSQFLDSKLESQKRKSFYLSFRSKGHRFLANWLPLVSEYLPWVLTYLTLDLGGYLLMLSEFKDLSALLPFLYYFVYYRVFRITLELFLREFVSNIPLKNRSHLNEKIQRTSKFLGLFLFGIYSAKAAFLSILGESLIFTLIEPSFGIFVLVLLFYISARWELEIEGYLKSSNIKWLQAYARRMENRYSLFLSLPGLLLIAIHFTTGRLVDWSSQFEIVRHLYAKILRVKYETTNDDSDKLPKVSEEYVDLFLRESEAGWDEHILKTEFFSKIESQVQLWSNDKTTEQTIAIYGPKGMGKSILLSRIAEHFSKRGILVETIKVPARVFTEKSFEQYFEDVFNTPEDTKKLVLVDNAHNLFLSTIGGFKIYKEFLEKIEAKNSIFWIASYGEQPWSFLNSVLGKNQYFRQELKIPKWSPEEINEMILGVHEKTGYNIQYDQIFRSSQRLHEEVSSAENRYFYLIWERSNGNPGLAIHYWFRSLRSIGGKNLKVCLPYDNPIQELTSLHQEMHFVYASLIKHESLNISEATRATNLPRAVVKQAVYRGLEEGFLEEEGGRYTIRLSWIDDLKRYLKGKNLIYELN